MEGTDLGQQHTLILQLVEVGCNQYRKKIYYYGTWELWQVEVHTVETSMKEITET